MVEFLLPTAQLLGYTITFSIVGLLLYAVGISVYNFYFHPLAKFPGPRLSRISDIPICLNSTSGKLPDYLTKLHEKYGDVVRLAPNDLSFTTLQSTKDIYGHASKNRRPFLKAALYTAPDRNVYSIVSERDPVKHRNTRQSLSHAFSTKALRDQTDVVLHYVDMFVNQISLYGSPKEGINMEEWYTWLTFDIIGDLAFGESFRAVENMRHHPWIETVSNSIFMGVYIDIFRRFPILKPLVFFILPKDMAKQRKQMLDYSRQKTAARLNKPNDRDDFFSHLLTEKATQNVGKDRLEDFFVVQSQTLILAGSETTATMLSGATYYLLKHPNVMQKLKHEVRHTFKDSREIDNDSTQSLPYLFAVIEETLRIFPPVPFSPPRESPGDFVDGHFIPKGTTVSSALQVMSHMKKYFHDPEAFRPERWLSPDHPDYIAAFANDQKDASKPFSLGPRVCLGINLAYMEMRIILARLIWHFDWELVNKDLDWKRDTQMRLLWKKPRIMVRFTPAAHLEAL